MKFVTRDTDYGIQALRYIAIKTKQDKNAIVSVDDIVSNCFLPREHLRLLLKELTVSNILKSYKGKFGGFALAKRADKINLADIVKIFQGDIDLTHCFLKNDPCPNIKKRCKVRAKFKEISKMVEKELKQTSIKALM
ncbi:Rrf2 family transcriptional regulator [bacterium]|nr:Rrf2 family transcriptional regulator [bacterium]